MRVLIVDDEPGICQRLQRELQKEGCEAEYTTSAIGVLERLKNAEQIGKAFALLLLDLRMPKADSLSLLREIREARLDLEVAITSGYGDEDKAIESIRLGAVDYLPKPISLEALHTVVFRVEQKRAAREEDALEHSILVVDDEKGLCKRIKRELDKEGYHTAVAYDGVVGLDYFSHNRVDVAIVDINMPRMSGLEMLEKCRQITGDFVPIVITGHGDQKKAIQALQLGVFNYLRKPLSLEELVISVGKGIELLHLRRGLAARKRELEIETALKDWYVQSLERTVEERTKELRKSEERYRTLFKYTGTALAVVEEDTTISLVNEEFERLSGYSREEIEGKKSWTDFVVREDLERIEAYHYARREGGEAPTSYEFKFVDRGGNVKDIYLNVGMIPGTKKSVASLVDVTERVRAEEEIKRRGEELEALREISLAITAQLELDELLLNAVEQGCRLLGVDTGGIYLVDEARGDLQLAVGHGYTRDYTGTRMAPGEGIAGRVLQSSAPLTVDDYSHWEGRSPSWEAELLTAVLAVPLKRGGQVIGVLEFAEVSRTRSFDENEVWLAKSVASQTAIALENARLYEESRHRGEEQKGLARIAASASSTLETDELIEQIMGETMRMLGSRAGMLLVADEKRGELTACYLKSPYLTEEIKTSWRIPMDAPGFENSIFVRGGSYFCNDVEDDLNVIPAYHPHIQALKVHNFAGVALRLKDRSIGELYVGDRPTEFGPEDTRLLRTIAGYVTNALENARLYQAEQRGRQVAEALQEAGRVVNASLDLDEVLPLILEQLGRVIQYDSGAVLLFDDGRFKVTAGRGFPDMEAALRLSFATGEDNLPSAVMRARCPLVIGDVQSDPRWQPDPAVTHIRGWIGAPLIVRSRVVGVLTVDSRQPEAYSEEDGQLVFAFADQAAVVIENARLFEDERRRAAQLETIGEVGRQITSLLELDPLLDRIVNLVRAAFDYRYVTILLIDPATGELMLEAGTGYEVEPVKALRLRVGEEGICGWVAASGEPLLVGDVSQEPHYCPVEVLSDTRSELALPIQVKGQVIGVLDVQSTELEAFNEDDIFTLQTLADQVAVAIENARLFQAERASRESADTLREISRIVGSTLELDDVLSLVLRQLKRVLTYDTASILLFADGQPSMVAVAGYEDEELVKTEASLRLSGSPILQAMARDHRPVVVADVREDDRWIRVPGAEEVRAWMGVPLLMRDEMIGALMIDSTQVGSYTEADAIIAQALANQTAVALENARMFEETRRRLQEVTLLSKVIALTATAEDLPTALQEVCTELAHFFQVPQVASALLNPQRTAAKVIAEYLEPGRPSALGVTIPVIGNPSMTYILEHKVPLAVTDAQTDPRLESVHAIMRQREVASILLVPVLIGGEVAGTLGIDAPQRREFSAGEVTLAQHVASQVGQALERLRLFAATREHDELMGRLASLSETLNRSFKVGEVVEAIGQGILALSCADRAAVYLRNPDDTVSCPWSHGLSPAYLEQVTTHLQEVPGGQMLESPEPILLSDVQALPEEALIRHLAQAEGYRAVSLWPLVYEERTLAAVGCFYDTPHLWSEAEQEIMSAFARQAAVALQNAWLYEESQRRLKHLQALRDVDMAITASLDLRVTLNVLLGQVTTHLEVDAADVLLLDPHTHTLEYAAEHGFRTSALRHTRLHLGEGHAGHAALERRVVYIPNLLEQETEFARSPLLASEEFVAYYGLPLIAKGQVKGVLEIFHRSPLAPNSEWQGFLESLATQAAIAIDSAFLFDELQRSNIELAQAYGTTLEGWARALELRDKETEGHSERVTEMTVRLARSMGVSEEELVHVRRGALLHDIGKMGIPDSILFKPGPLTEEEWEIMHQHPVHAYELLSSIPFLRRALDIPYYHHEKWDGTGYPRGLKGEQIPLAARIFAVVDVWDALRSDRLYRGAWPEKKVLKYLREQAGKHFDPQVVEAFLKILKEP